MSSPYGILGRGPAAAAAGHTTKMCCTTLASKTLVDCVLFAHIMLTGVWLAFDMLTGRTNWMDAFRLVYLLCLVTAVFAIRARMRAPLVVAALVMTAWMLWLVCLSVLIVCFVLYAVYDLEGARDHIKFWITGIMEYENVGPILSALPLAALIVVCLLYVNALFVLIYIHDKTAEAVMGIAEDLGQARSRLPLTRAALSQRVFGGGAGAGGATVSHTVSHSTTVTKPAASGAAAAGDGFETVPLYPRI